VESHPVSQHLTVIELHNTLQADTRSDCTWPCLWQGGVGSAVITSILRRVVDRCRADSLCDTRSIHVCVCVCVCAERVF